MLRISDLEQQSQTRQSPYNAVSSLLYEAEMTCTGDTSAHSWNKWYNTQLKGEIKEMSNKITCLSQCKPAGVATPENIIKYSDVVSDS